MNWVIEWNEDNSFVSIKINDITIKVNNDISIKVNNDYVVSTNKDILDKLKTIVVIDGLSIGSCFDNNGLYQSLEVDDITKKASYKKEINNLIKSLGEQFKVFATNGLSRDKSGGDIYSKVYQVCVYILTILTRVYVCTLLPSGCKDTFEKNQETEATEANIKKMKSMLKDTTQLLLNIDDLKIDDVGNTYVPNGATNGGANGPVGNGSIGNVGQVVTVPTNTVLTYGLSVSDQNLKIRYTGGDESEEISIDLVNLSKLIAEKNKTTELFSIPLFATTEGDTLYLNKVNFQQNLENIKDTKKSIRNLINAIKTTKFDGEFDSYLESKPIKRDMFIGLKFAIHAIYVIATKLFIATTVMLSAGEKVCVRLSDRQEQYNELKNLYTDTTSILLNIDTYFDGSTMSTNSSQGPKA
jgi:hypothetical protein